MKEILDFLENQRNHHLPNEIKEYIKALGINIPAEKVILVAGTNGKGSTCATLQTLLLAANKNVGFFSSPHLIKINERIKYNGKDISDEEFCKIFNIIHNKFSDINLSFFEYLTLIALYYYHNLPIDYAIFEVGLGGTLDATNSIDHNISIITRLGLDHEDILGKGLISIAKNKFGIIRDNNKVFHTKFPAEVQDLYEEHIRNKHAQSFEAPVLNYHIEDSTYPKYYITVNNKDYKLNLLGKRAVENTSLSIEVFKYLIKDYEPYLPALQQVYWSCRMEKFKYKDRDIFMSGDHNPQAIQTLIDILEHFKFENLYVVIGTCLDKDTDQMIQMLKTIKNSHIYLTETPTKTRFINQYSNQTKLSAEFLSNDPIETLNQACQKASNQDLIIVTGSLYLTGRIASYLSKTTQDRSEYH